MQQNVVHCESRDIIPTIFYTSFVTDQTYLDQIPLPSTNPSSMSFVTPTLAPLTTASFIIPLTKSDQRSPDTHDDDDSDSDDSDDDDSSSESDSSDSDSDDEVDDDDSDEEVEKPKEVLKSEKTRLKPLPKIRLSKNFYDTVDSFEILEQTILKQKRLSRLKNTDLRKKILLKRTFDLVCEIMDRENGFDDLNDDAKPPTAVVPIEPKTTTNSGGVNTLTSPIQSGAELHIVQLDQQPPMPTQSQPNETELNDIIYLNLINQSDLIDALNESTAAVVDSNNNSSSVCGNSISKKRRFSSDEDEEEDEYYEYEEYEDDYYSKKNIVILNKHQDKENLENQSQSNQSIELTTATSTCLFYSDAERVAERTKLSVSSNSPKRTRFG